jgi:hypothetical protein
MKHTGPIGRLRFPPWLIAGWFLPPGSFSKMASRELGPPHRIEEIAFALAVSVSSLPCETACSRGCKKSADRSLWSRLGLAISSVCEALPFMLGDFFTVPHARGSVSRERSCLRFNCNRPPGLQVRRRKLKNNNNICSNVRVSWSKIKFNKEDRALREFVALSPLTFRQLSWMLATSPGFNHFWELGQHFLTLRGRELTRIPTPNCIAVVRFQSFNRWYILEALAVRQAPMAAAA